MMTVEPNLKEIKGEVRFEVEQLDKQHSIYSAYQANQ